MSIESDRPDLIEFVYVLRIADKRQLEYMAEQIAEERKARRNWLARHRLLLIVTIIWSLLIVAHGQEDAVLTALIDHPIIPAIWILAALTVPFRWAYLIISLLIKKSISTISCWYWNRRSFRQGSTEETPPRASNTKRNDVVANDIRGIRTDLEKLFHTEPNPERRK